MGQEYYLGLDMGTNSVGWAVTDDQYKLLKKSGKDLWGVREFDEASVSTERRNKRTNRRRRQREQVRIGLLKEYFDEEIKKTDPLFYIRMENSKYFPEDKDNHLKSVNGIFDDADYKDKDYYHAYPTVFHLRESLINDTVPHDDRYARLVFLALLNMFKHRGHFLSVGLSDEGTETNSEELFLKLNSEIFELLEIDVNGDISILDKELTNHSISKSERARRMLQTIDVDDKKVKEIFGGICGLQFNIKKIFDDIESEEKMIMSFSDSSYEENADIYLQTIGAERFELIETMKQLCEAGILSAILKGEKYLSVAYVKEYEKHKEELCILKTLYKKYGNQTDYDSMFRMDEKGSYSAYIGSNLNSKYTLGKTSRRKAEDCKKEDIYKRIKKFLENIDDARANTILNDMKEGTFLSKLRSTDNGVIPNQVHLREMKAILKNAKKYLVFLNEVNEYGITVAEQIQQLFSFQIPYYVGPVTENSAKYGGNGWVIRKENGQVLPWNIDEKIDLEHTKEAFIQKLIRECTYISGEKVLPKSSLMYEAYCVLNEINNIKIDGEDISIELKQDIYNELFKMKNKVSRKDISKYLVARGFIESDAQITGIDTNINNALTSYRRFRDVFGEEIESDSCKKMCERIIELCTIFGESKKMLKETLKKEFAEKVTDEQLKRIQGYKFRDWGRLSKEVLNLQGCNPLTGKQVSLIRALWETNYNFMELLNKDEFMFKDALESKQKTFVSTLSEFTADDLKEYYFSAPVRRMIWQTILIVKEIEKIMGYAPTRVFIEMTRSNDEKKGDRGRKDSRGKQLQELYRTIKDSERDWISEIKSAEADGSLRSKKLFLYYLQMGKCLYTGEAIDLDELMKANSKYDIDHIYPRHYVKDDSIINNLVLVNKTSNAYKSDDYPLMKMKPEVYDLWKTLHSKKLMSDEKYKRLTGRQPFSEEQLAGFIARQLVETGQGTKGIADILKMLLPQDMTKIIYVKGGNVSEFRKKYDLLKSRTINDFHHAKDAYLNIVVGNAYYTKFTQNPRNFIYKEYMKDAKKNHYNLGKMFEWNIERDGYQAWSVDGDGVTGTIKTVKTVMKKNTPMITKRTFVTKGAISKETLYAAECTDTLSYIPLKNKDRRMKDISKYGGFTGVNGAYFLLVEHSLKKKRVRTIEYIPIYLAASIKNDNDLYRYCVEFLGLDEPKICISRIKMQSLVKIDGFLYRISGRTGDRIILRNAVSLCLDQNWTNYIHKMDKFMETGNLSADITNDKNMELFDVMIKKHSNEIFKNRKNPVDKILISGRDKFLKLKCEKQCIVIEEILKLSAIESTGANLTVIGGAAKSGVMLCSKDITKTSECILFNQSITGFYENAVDLLSV